MARFISIVSLRPNIGNTTVALNLGLALHNLGHKVIVLDADFSKMNMLEHLYMDDVPIDLSRVVNNDAHIFDSILKHKSGLRIIPSIKAKESNSEKIGLHLDELSPNNDFVILDMPKRPELMEGLLEHVDEALIVHSPEYSSKTVFDVQRLLSRNKITNLGIILNKSHEGSVNSIFATPVISKIPENKNIIKSFQLKHPLLHLYPNSGVSKKFFQIAERLS